MDRFGSSAVEPSAPPLMHEQRFHTSLSQLKTQLEAMNRRTASLLHHHNPHSEVDLASDQMQSQSFPKVPEHLQLPNGPAFWQLFRSLRSDVRGLDARIELVEERVEAISDRLDRRDPSQFTPSQSPSNFGDFMPSHIHGGSAYVPQPALQAKEDPVTAPAPKPVATTGDIGYYNPDLVLNDEMTMQNQHLYTSDVVVFVAKLRRASRTKQIVNVDQFLRGPALRLYRIGFGTDGTNIFDFQDEQCNVERLAGVLILVFGKSADALGLLEAGKYTLTDALDGRRLVQDYAFDMLELGRHLPDCSQEEARMTTYVNIQNSLQTSAPGLSGTQTWDKAESLEGLLHYLRKLENGFPRTVDGMSNAASPSQSPQRQSQDNDHNGPSVSTYLANKKCSQAFDHRDIAGAELRTAVTPTLSTCTYEPSYGRALDRGFETLDTASSVPLRCTEPCYPIVVDHTDLSSHKKVEAHPSDAQPRSDCSYDPFEARPVAARPSNRIYQPTYTNPFEVHTSDAQPRDYAWPGNPVSERYRASMAALGAVPWNSQAQQNEGGANWVVPPGNAASSLYTDYNSVPPGYAYPKRGDVGWHCMN